MPASRTAPRADESSRSGDVLAVRGATKSYGATRALRGVDLTVSAGQVHALLGANGSGKSTLVRLLAGVEHGGAGGTITVGGQEHPLSQWTAANARAAGLAFVHQDPAVFPGVTAAENLALGRTYATGRFGRIRWRDVRQSGAELLRRYGLHIDPDTPVEQLTAPERTLLAVVRAVSDLDDRQGGLVVFDEPTATLPESEAGRVTASMRQLAGTGHGVVFVTHRLQEVFAVADWVTVLRDGQATLSGPVGALAQADVVRAIVGEDQAPSSPRSSRAARSKRPTVLSVQDAATDVLSEVTFNVTEGEVVGLAGLMGSGTSEMLRALFADNRLAAGSLRLSDRPYPTRPVEAVAAGIAYLPADRAGEAVLANLTVEENVTGASVGQFWSGLRLRAPAERSAAATALATYKVRPPDPARDIGTLSGGNQQKVMLARLLTRAPRLLLLDEPTQGIDVGARADIWSQIHESVDTGMAVVVASTDVDELVGNCDRVLVFFGGRLIETVAGHRLAATLVSRLSHGVLDGEPAGSPA